MLDYPCADGRNRILSALSKDDYSLIATDLESVVVHQGSVLHEHGELITHVYFPHDSVVALMAVMQHGQSVETATIGCEGVLGATSGLGDRIASATAMVQVPGEASRIASVRFEKAALRSNRLQQIIMRYTEILLAQVQQTAACNALHPAESRLARWLLHTQDRVSRNRFPYTQELLAQMLGVRRATVSEAVRTLRAAGLISVRRGEIEVLDRKGLERFTCECYETIRTHLEEPLI